jgi:hypothetical protein
MSLSRAALDFKADDECVAACRRATIARRYPRRPPAAATSAVPFGELAHQKGEFLARFGELLFVTLRAIETLKTPVSMSSCRHSESMVRGMRGMARRISLKRRLPQRSPRATSKVHLPPSTSWARATEQNWP